MNVCEILMQRAQGSGATFFAPGQRAPMQPIAVNVNEAGSVDNLDFVKTRSDAWGSTFAAHRANFDALPQAGYTPPGTYDSQTARNSQVALLDQTARPFVIDSDAFDKFTLQANITIAAGADNLELILSLAKECLANAEASRDRALQAKAAGDSAGFEFHVQSMDTWVQRANEAQGVAEEYRAHLRPALDASKAANAARGLALQAYKNALARINGTKSNSLFPEFTGLALVLAAAVAAVALSGKKR